MAPTVRAATTATELSEVLILNILCARETLFKLTSYWRRKDGVLVGLVAVLTGCLEREVLREERQHLGLEVHPHLPVVIALESLEGVRNPGLGQGSIQVAIAR